jgi:hypothetical protein
VCAIELSPHMICDRQSLPSKALPQALVVGDLHLNTSPDQLDAYVSMLKLEPYVDERLEGALLRHYGRADCAATAAPGLSD